MNNFYDRVYQVVLRIPEGRVSTYGSIAAFLGAARSARMVGYALKSSAANLHIPAHRVVNRHGLLTGKHYFSGSHMMEQLLMAEGVQVKEDQVVDFSRHFWDPAQHLQPQDYL